ncbi:alginate export family protein [Sandarakinorhabdus limnophila]|uniref:alginate export family protein n=1 Tax=Sandarakinorhabdus limnophila TaxID=210512 RepID=UPI0026F25670|nr:alginate export family protein [Sandarakinorhabdus limnophila]MCM0034064.1 alginate export family protein [Sandarakinorhabdus limnophila]
MIFALPAHAEGPPPRPPKDKLFALSATLRARYEAIDGQARAHFNRSDELVSFRTILTADYRPDPQVHLVAELWDSRVYGGNRGTPVSTGEVNTLEPAQLFVGVTLPGALGRGSKIDLQAGRFLLALGSRRLVAADEYRNTTNSSTGVRADLATPGGWMATLVYVLPQQRLPNDLDSLLDNDVALDRERFDLVLWGGLVTRAKTIAGAMAEIGFVHFGERDAPGRPTRDRSLDTFSGRLIRDPAPQTWDFEMEAIMQRGTVSASLATNAPTQDVRAWFVHGDLGYSFAGPWKPRLALEYDHASGDRPGGRYSRFDPLLGMRRADLAPGALYNAILRSNFISPGVRLEAVPSAKTDLMVSYRPFWLAAREDAFSSTGVQDSSGRSGSFAGHQLDTRLRYSLTPTIRLEADVVMLAKGRFLREAPNAPPGSWTRYVSINTMLLF